MGRRNKWGPALILALGGCLLVLLGLRSYRRDVRALEAFLASCDSFDRAISDLAARPADAPDRTAREALADLQAKASMRLSSLIRNDGEFMRLAREIAELSRKELESAEAYRKANLDRAADREARAGECRDLAAKRRAAWDRYRELAREGSGP